MMSQGSDSAPMSQKDNSGSIIYIKAEYNIENQVALPIVILNMDPTALKHSDDSKRRSTEQTESLLSVSPERSFNHDIDQTDEEGCTLLYKAASKGQLEGVKILVENGADPNKANEDGRRALHVAAEEGHVAIVHFLVKQGADVDAECGLGQTALYTAVHNNQYPSALFLSLNGADIYKRDNYGRTPLHMAAAAGNIQIFEHLVDKACDLNVEDDMGLTVLHHTVKNGRSNIANYLLEKGAKETPYGGDSLIFASASFGNLDLVKLFISRGGDVNEENGIGQNPLHVAASKGYLDITKCLVQEGCEMNKKDHEDFTPVHGAVLNGNLDVLDYLITQGAEITKYDGKSVLQLAAIHGHLDILQYFMKMGADVSELDDSGQTPLHVAADGGHLGVVKYLIEQGSKIDKQDHRGYAPLHIAAAKGRLEIVKYLIDQNCCKKELDKTGFTPLALAAIHGHLDTVKYLADGGVDETASLYGAALSGHLDIVRFFMNRISLHLAAYRDDLDNVQYLVQQGFDINSCDKKGWTPLEYAIQNNNCEVIDFLLKKGAKGDQGKEESPLYMASRLGHLEAVNVLISRGISVNAEGHRGQIPLHAAATTGRIQVVESLIENGSDLNKTDVDGWTPLHAAVQNGHLEVVRYLMSKGAIYIKYRGMTSLHIAAQSGHLKIVKHLNNRDANLNDEDNLGRIPLHSAAMKGDIELVHYLVEHGSEVNKSDFDGWTPMHEALQTGNLFIVQYLIKKGAKLTKYKGMTPLYIASSAGHLDIVDLLLSNGADVNEEHGTGCIPLHAAAVYGSLEIVEKLINCGSNVNKMADNGWTPLHAAVYGGRLAVVQYLISHGATRSRFKGMTVLYIAAQHGYTELLEYFATTECDIDDGTDNGKSPLLAACYNGDMDSVEILVIHGASLNQADGNKWTPVHAAAQEGHLPVVKYLVENGADAYAKDANGMTPLQATEDGDHEDVKQYLIRFRTGVKYERHKHTKKTDGITSIQTAEEADHQDVLHCINRFRTEVQDERHKDREKTDGMTPLQTAEDAGHHDVQQFPNYLRAEVHDERHKDTAKTDGMTPHQAAEDAGQKYIIRFREEVQDERQDDKEKSFRPDENCPEMVRGSGMSKVSACDKLSGINGECDYPMPLNVTTASILMQNPWRKNPDTLPRHIKKTIRPTRESCVAKPKTQLYGGEVPATDDLAINRENSAGDPKPGMKTPRRLNPDSLSRHIKTTNRPTRLSCVSKPNTQLHGGEVPATNNVTITNENDAVDPKQGIKSKRRNIENCFSILTLLHRAIIVLAFFFACPILVAGNLTWPEPVTLEAGTRGVVTFYLERPSSTLQFSLFYNIQFGSKGRPFCINGQNDADGFKDPSQESRYTTTVIDRDTSPCVNMTIDDVHTIDGDQYIFIGVWHSLENVLYDTQKKEVVVERTPGPADCFITLSDHGDSEFPYELQCWAKTGSMPTTLTCFQNDRDLVKVHNITNNGQTTRAIFLLPHATHFSCCSHDITSTVAAATCNDFEWPPSYSGIPSAQKTTSGSMFVGEKSNWPTDTRAKTNTVGSGACSLIMIPSEWHFLYLLIYLLVFVVNCVCQS